MVNASLTAELRKLLEGPVGLVLIGIVGFFIGWFLMRPAAGLEPALLSPAGPSPKGGVYLVRQGETDVAAASVPVPHRRPPELRPPPARVAGTVDRLVCLRLCDGARLTLAVAPRAEDHRLGPELCALAGAGAPTMLFVERALPEHALHRAAEIRAAAAPIPRGECAPGRPGTFSIPLLSDPTLRPGDFVMIGQRMSVFRGRIDGDRRGARSTHPAGRGAFASF